MKRNKSITAVVLVVLGLGGAGAWWSLRDRETAPDELRLFGNVDIRQVQLAFNGSDRIARLLVEEGDRVKKGQLVATLDDRRLLQNISLRQAEVAAQRQLVARLVAGSRPEEIRKARADVEAARSEADNAERNDRRAQALVAQKFMAKQQADNAKATAEGAEARLAAAREALRLVVLGPRKEDIAAARATLRAQEASLALAREEQADASLYAPADGIIQDRLLEPGDMASPQRSVYTLALVDPVWVRAYVSGQDLGKLHPGMAAEVSTDSFPGRRYLAWVGYISPSAEFTPKSVETTEVRSSLVYQLRVFVCSSRDELRLGMPATVIIPLGKSPAGDKSPAGGKDKTGHCPNPA